MEGRPIAVKGVGAVQEQHVQMYVQVQGRAEALNQRDCSGMGTRGHGEARSVNYEGRDGPKSARFQYPDCVNKI